MPSNGTPIDDAMTRIAELEQDRDVWKHLAETRQAEIARLEAREREARDVIEWLAKYNREIGPVMRARAWLKKGGE